MSRHAPQIHGIEFYSEGKKLRGVLYTPPGSGPHPAIVVTHGFGFVKEAFLDHNYPSVFAEAGFTVLVYDHPTTGESEGLPRQELDPIVQQRGYRDAITFLSQQDGVDADRIGVWGTSYSGGHVLAVAAADRRVRCVVSQVMTISGRENLHRRNSPEELARLRKSWLADRAARMRGEPAGTLLQVRPEVAEERTEVEEFITSLPEECLRNFDPRVTLRTYEYYYEYEPAAAIEHISPTPLLMIVCSNDTVTFTDLALAAYNRAREPKKLLLLEGRHADAYRKHFRSTSNAAVEWFREHLT